MWEHLETIRQFAEDLALALYCEPPVCPAVVALQHEIALIPSPSTTYSDKSGWPWVIWLGPHTCASRARFGLAHELMALIYPIPWELAAHEERIHHAGAAELLMPTLWWDEARGLHDCDLAALRGTFGVSYEAGARRLALDFDDAVLTIWDNGQVICRLRLEHTPPPLQELEREAAEKCRVERAAVCEECGTFVVRCWWVPPQRGIERVIALTTCEN